MSLFLETVQEIQSELRRVSWEQWETQQLITLWASAACVNFIVALMLKRRILIWLISGLVFPGVSLLLLILMGEGNDVPANKRRLVIFLLRIVNLLILFSAGLILTQQDQANFSTALAHVVVLFYVPSVIAVTILAGLMYRRTWLWFLAALILPVVTGTLLACSYSHRPYRPWLIIFVDRSRTTRVHLKRCLAEKRRKNTKVLIRNYSFGQQMSRKDMGGFLQKISEETRRLTHSPKLDVQVEYFKHESDPLMFLAGSRVYATSDRELLSGTVREFSRAIGKILYSLRLSKLSQRSHDPAPVESRDKVPSQHANQKQRELEALKRSVADQPKLVELLNAAIAEDWGAITEKVQFESDFALASKLVEIDSNCPAYWFMYAMSAGKYGAILPPPIGNEPSWQQKDRLKTEGLRAALKHDPYYAAAVEELLYHVGGLGTIPENGHLFDEAIEATNRLLVRVREPTSIFRARERLLTGRWHSFILHQTTYPDGQMMVALKF